MELCLTSAEESTLVSSGMLVYAPHGVANHEQATGNSYEDIKWTYFRLTALLNSTYAMGGLRFEFVIRAVS